MWTSYKCFVGNWRYLRRPSIIYLERWLWTSQLMSYDSITTEEKVAILSEFRSSFVFMLTPGPFQLIFLTTKPTFNWGLPWWPSRRCGIDPWVREIPWRRKWQPTPVLLPGKSHEPSSLAGYSPWGHKRIGHELATKQQQLHLVFTVFSSRILSQSFYQFY